MTCPKRSPVECSEVLTESDQPVPECSEKTVAPLVESALRVPDSRIKYWVARDLKLCGIAAFIRFAAVTSPKYCTYYRRAFGPIGEPRIRTCAIPQCCKGVG